jgi:signal peptidase
LQSDNSISKTVRFLRKNPTARVILLIVLLFIITYGGIEVLRIAMQTESPLMVVSSGSMIPTLNVGDIILVRGVDAGTVAVGTIIIFHDPNDYAIPIVHRVVAVDDQGGQLYFETKGDNNPVKDGWLVPAQDLMGVYVGKVPYIGLLSLELHGPAGATLIVLLIALIIAIEYNESRHVKPKNS